MEAIMRLLKALKELKVSLHQQEKAEKLSIAATLFSLQIIQAEGKMGETMPKLPTSSEVHPWNEWMEWHNGFIKSRIHI